MCTSAFKAQSLVMSALLISFQLHLFSPSFVEIIGMRLQLESQSKMLEMDSRSKAVTPTVVTVVHCLYLEDVNASLLWFLCVLSFFYETDLGASRQLAALHRTHREERLDSQLPLHLLCTLEHSNCFKTRDTS